MGAVVGGAASAVASALSLEVSAPGMVTQKHDLSVLFADETMCFPFELNLDADLTGVEVSLKYSDVVDGSAMSTLGTFPIQVGDHHEPATLADSTLVDTHRNRKAATDAIDAAVVAAQDGRFSDARVFLQDAKDAIEASLGAKQPICAALMADLEALKAAMVDRNAFVHSGGMALALASSAAHNLQRSSGAGNMGGGVVYATPLVAVASHMASHFGGN
jgi:hypothetical protein